MTAARSTDGLKKATRRRRTEAHAKVMKALREMKRTGAPINPNSVARHANVARKTIYNNDNLLNAVRAASTTARPQIAEPSSTAAKSGSSVDAALRNQLRTQKRRYDTDVAGLKAEIKDLQHQLAAAYGEIHRLRSAANDTT